KRRKARALVAEIDGAVQLEPVRARRDREARRAALPVSLALRFQAPTFHHEGASSLGKASGRKRQDGAPLPALSAALESELREARPRAAREVLVAPHHAARIRLNDTAGARPVRYLRPLVVEGKLRAERRLLPGRSGLGDEPEAAMRYDIDFVEPELLRQVEAREVRNRKERFHEMRGVRCGYANRSLTTQCGDPAERLRRVEPGGLLFREDESALKEQDRSEER